MQTKNQISTYFSKQVDILKHLSYNLILISVIFMPQMTLKHFLDIEYRE